MDQNNQLVIYFFLALGSLVLKIQVGNTPPIGSGNMDQNCMKNGVNDITLIDKPKISCLNLYFTTSYHIILSTENQAYTRSDINLQSLIVYMHTKWQEGGEEAGSGIYTFTIVPSHSLVSKNTWYRDIFLWYVWCYHIHSMRVIFSIHWLTRNS